MLIQAPAIAGRTYVAGLINGCASNKEITELGEVYLGQFVDYYNDAVKFMPGLRSEAINTKAAVRITGCCNILPQYGGYDDMDEFNYPDTTLWQLVYLFGGVSESQLGEHGVHGLGNVLTLEYGLRSIFDGFDIWLEPTGEADNQYFIKGQEESDCRGLPERVTFYSSFPGLELPSPQYLSVHAAFARVIKLSGASRIIARIIRDLENNRVLSWNGSSAQVLNQLLSAETLKAF
ncbi:hypothetical protein BN14_11465 [Rhizoctonia solani AG-1 IB]|uniref:HNH nuclease domain-containing protein n=1 Tax=Thanatephorus cucumeris (strain AG1-IB / isolate 7/3/14) TaxID=1108050 RepID=M5CDS8_THACB|nr:hypothetical protein BN14_11465 [Rhizoctonia solani AG-1 IB]